MANDNRGRRNWISIRLAIWVIVLAILAVFIALNFEEVTIDLMFEEVETKLGWALLATSLLGFIAGYFWPHRRR